jgi:hypothetical protein
MTFLDKTQIDDEALALLQSGWGKLLGFARVGPYTLASAMIISGIAGWLILGKVLGW